MRFKWSDKTAKEFARVACAGSYGFYRGCKTLDAKLERFKLIHEYNLHSTSRYIGGANRELIVYEGDFIGSEAHKLVAKVLEDYNPMFISHTLYKEIAVDVKIVDNIIEKM